jgi:hypothetical protein
MYSRQIQKYLYEHIADDYLSTEEFQDKYFFKKLVQDRFPYFSDKIIYDAIDKCNLMIKKPRKKKDYLKQFSKTLSETINYQSR